MKKSLLLVSLSITATIIGVALESRRTARLEQERAEVLRQNQTLIQLRAENNQLTEQLPTSAELENMRSAATEASNLRAALARRTSTSPLPPSPPTQPTLAVNGGWTGPADWKNQGRATGRATLETVLWAAERGELAALRETIELSPEARAKANELLERLPPEVRARYASPEDLAALFTARDAVFEKAQSLYEQPTGSDRMTIAVEGKSATGQDRQVALEFHRTEGSWRLVMPGRAMDKIANELAGKPPTTKRDVPPPRG